MSSTSLILFVTRLIVHSVSLCPHERLLWNGLCRPEKWSSQNISKRQVVVPQYLSKDFKPPVINISNGRQLFVDTFLIDTDKSNNTQTTYHSAKYTSSQNPNPNPVLVATEPWEIDKAGFSGGYGGFASPFSGGIWWNPSQHRYELFYRCGSWYCVAWSNDTLIWTKPKLPFHRDSEICNGQPCNVIVPNSYDGATVWLDLDTKNASRRYIFASGSIYAYVLPALACVRCFSELHYLSFVHHTWRVVHACRRQRVHYLDI